MIKELKERIKVFLRDIICQKIYGKKIQLLENQLRWFKDHSEITMLKPATGYLRNEQLQILKLANDFIEDTKHLDIKPFLMAGNLIGAVRHKGYVPWDDDLDFGVSREDSDKIIDFCNKHGVIDIYEGKWSDYSYGEIYRRQKKMLKRHPGKYILDIWVNQLQLYRGTSVLDVHYLDFWPFDYYHEGYSIDDHMLYLQNVLKKMVKIDKVDKILEFLNKERKENPNISRTPTAVFFPGIDNVIGYDRIKRTYDWLYSKDIFPLRKIEFENQFFWAPKNTEKYLNYEYPDYMDYPEIVGQNPHEIYKDMEMSKIIPVVSIRFSDVEELGHVFTVYNSFESHEIYSAVICEKKEWCKLLDEKCLRVRKEKIKKSYDLAINKEGMLFKNLSYSYTDIGKLIERIKTLYVREKKIMKILKAKFNDEN